MGTCGLIGTDDLLACFVAGNVFTQEYVYIHNCLVLLLNFLK
jgi:hypothetical protein